MPKTDAIQAHLANTEEYNETGGLNSQVLLYSTDTPVWWSKLMAWSLWNVYDLLELMDYRWANLRTVHDLQDGWMWLYT